MLFYQRVRVKVPAAGREMTYRYRVFLRKPLGRAEVVYVDGGVYDGEIGYVTRASSGYRGYTYPVRREERRKPRRRRGPLGLFSRTPKQVDDQDSPEEIEASISRINRIAEALDKVDLSSANLELREKNQALELEAERKEEEFARRERDTEHNVALLRKQIEAEQEQARTQNEADRENAVREAKLAVKEEAQEQAERRADEHIEFIKEHMEREIATLRSQAERVFSLVPNYTVHREEQHLSGDGKALPAGDASEE